MRKPPEVVCRAEWGSIRQRVGCDATSGYARPGLYDGRDEKRKRLTQRRGSGMVLLNAGRIGVCWGTTKDVL